MANIELITAKEVAARCGISLASVHRMAKDGRIKSVRRRNARSFRFEWPAVRDEVWPPVDSQEHVE